MSEAGSRARRIRLDLAYDGSDFVGWQSQSRGRTVQSVIERALGKLHGRSRLPVRGAGRTDSGVHAWGQVADCEVRSRLDDDDLAYALRRLLPHDVRPVRVRTVDDRFHSRKDARSKTYVYRLDTSRHGDPFSSRYALHHPQTLDLEAIRRGLERLPGRRDWTGFTSSACDKEDRVRELHVARLIPVSDTSIGLEFSGDGFLRYMVRNLVGTLLEIGRGRMTSEDLERAISERDRDLAGPTAAARGLHLVQVRYAGEGRVDPAAALWSPALVGTHVGGPVGGPVEAVDDPD